MIATLKSQFFNLSQLSKLNWFKQGQILKNWLKQQKILRKFLSQFLLPHPKPNLNLTIIRSNRIIFRKNNRFFSPRPSPKPISKQWKILKLFKSHRKLYLKNSHRYRMNMRKSCRRKKQTFRKLFNLRKISKMKISKRPLPQQEHPFQSVRSGQCDFFPNFELRRCRHDRCAAKRLWNYP